MPLNGKYQNRKKVTIRIFPSLALTVCEISLLQIFDRENLCQGHQIQHLQWCLSATNTDLYKRYSTHLTLSLSLTVSEILRFEVFHLDKLGQCHGVQHSSESRSMANINVCISKKLAFFWQLLPHPDVIVSNFENLKKWKMWRYARFAVAPFDSKCQPLQTS